MSLETVGKLWKRISYLLLFYAVNTWLSSQGARPVLDIQLLDDRPIPGAVIGFFVCALLLIAAMRFAARYQARKRGDWAARVPLVGVSDLDVESKAGRRYQAAVLAAFIGVPTAALIHFFRITMTAQPFARDTGETVGLFAWQGFDSLWNDGFRVGDGGGVTFIPLVEPVVMIALLAWALWLVGRYFLALATERPSPSETAGWHAARPPLYEPLRRRATTESPRDAAAA